MTKTIIPAGYRLTIMSWENDMDACKNEILEGLTKERVEFLIELCSLFKSRSCGKSFYGNMYEPSELERNDACLAVAIVMSKHFDVLEDDEKCMLGLSEDDSIQDFVVEFMGDMLGYGEGYWVRVFDGAKVEYTPVEIILNDVTSQFI
jgi:hypothetical protein